MRKNERQIFAEPIGFEPEKKEFIFKSGSADVSILPPYPIKYRGKKNTAALRHTDSSCQSVVTFPRAILANVFCNTDSAFAIKYPGEVSDLEFCEHDCFSFVSGQYTPFTATVH